MRKWPITDRNLTGLLYGDQEPNEKLLSGPDQKMANSWSESYINIQKLIIIMNWSGAAKMISWLRNWSVLISWDANDKEAESHRAIAEPGDNAARYMARHLT